MNEECVEIELRMSQEWTDNMIVDTRCENWVTCFIKKIICVREIVPQNKLCRSWMQVKHVHYS